MSGQLHAHLVGYLAMRRALGFRLVRAQKLLEQFLDYLDRVGATALTVDLAVAWARLPGGHACWPALRLSVVRGFAVYLHAIDPGSPLIPTDLLPARGPRAVPYLYSDAEVDALMAATASLRTPWRAATYRTLIGLLWATGMRVGEALALDLADLDLARGLVVVRDGKFGKSRELPLHPSVTDAVGAYLRRADRPPAASGTRALLLSTAGTRPLYCNVHWTWQRLAAQAGLTPNTDGHQPRIHDLRHSFAVSTLLTAYAENRDPARTLTLLSTYLGHVDPATTYWYLHASPELLAAAAARLESRLEVRP